MVYFIFTFDDNNLQFLSVLVLVGLHFIHIIMSHLET